MSDRFSTNRRRAALLAGAALAFAGAASASRVGSAPPPAASAVVSSPQQPAHSQADESASLRQGIVTAIDERRGRVQVQGVWLEATDAKTKLLRAGRPAPLDTLRAGEAIRFTVAPETSGAQSLRVIYAP